ncbi:hypothetical protein AB4Y32_09915 [Paraburkholderia phymatum]|uniref:Uncharacterized protein n=1 Tax=Paraburkholderia phymatum TaxID=148447 RepID=A0ACC6TXN9_9BURK
MDQVLDLLDDASSIAGHADIELGTEEQRGPACSMYTWMSTEWASGQCDLRSCPALPSTMV